MKRKTENANTDMNELIKVLRPYVIFGEFKLKHHYNEEKESDKMVTKRGTDVLNNAYATISKELNSTTRGKEFLSLSPHIEQRLAYFICRDLGLICSHMDDEGNWITGCNRPVRARGLCMEHYQEKYHKYVFNDGMVEKE